MAKQRKDKWQLLNEATKKVADAKTFDEILRLCFGLTGSFMRGSTDIYQAEISKVLLAAARRAGKLAGFDQVS